MDKILDGYRRFRAEMQDHQSEFLASLGKKPQRPQSLFITCADSRIDPNRITGTEPGDLFILRNAGNLVPPYGYGHGATTAGVEYAVAALKVNSIVVCGHSHCGAMTALLDPSLVENLPAVSSWLTNAENTRQLFAAKHSNVPEQRRLTLAAEENVLTQLANLMTHPSVAAALAMGELELYGCMYYIESGELQAFFPSEGRFLPLDEREAEPLPNPVHLQLQPETQMA